MKLAFLFGSLLMLWQGNEATLRARIAELEAQVKALEGKSSQSSSGWKTLGSWKGNGTKNTESFKTSKGEWRLAWKSSAFLSVQVYDVNRKLVGIPVSSTTGGADTSFVRAPAGSFYLEIQTISGNWEVAAEEK